MILQDKVVIISGIGPGLGGKLALLAGREGAKVAIAARTMSRLEDFEEQLAEIGVDRSRVLKVATDITDQDACHRLADQVVGHFGRIDALINSAYAPGKPSPVDQANLDDWQESINVNLLGTLKLSQAVIPSMRKQGGGSIVMINTMATHKPLYANAGYSASKAALAAASANMALELGKDGIRVNSVYMGWMWGAPVKGYVEQAARDRNVTAEDIEQEVIANIPLGRIPTDEECGKAAIFFASDYSSAITGATLDVNGGEYLPH